MNKLSFDAFWSIWPEAWQQLQAQLAIAMSGVAAGPVDDAQKLGLPIQKHGNVAVVTLHGPMIKEDGFLTYFFGFASSRATEHAIGAALDDREVSVIILNIDSPGGSVDGLAELSDMVARASREKTVIAQVDGMAASAAYMVASQANSIFAGRMDLVGSIGTRMLLFDLSEAFKNEGIKAVPIDTGKFKSAGALGTEITDEQIAEFQRIVDGFFDDFVKAIMNGRGMSEKAVRAVGDGRIFFAEEAINLGLIDGIQTMAKTFSDSLELPESRNRVAGLRNKLTLRKQQI